MRARTLVVLASVVLVIACAVGSWLLAERRERALTAARLRVLSSLAKENQHMDPLLSNKDSLRRTPALDAPGPGYRRQSQPILHEQTPIPGP